MLYNIIMEPNLVLEKKIKEFINKANIVCKNDFVIEKCHEFYLKVKTDAKLKSFLSHRKKELFDYITIFSDCNQSELFSGNQLLWEYLQLIYILSEDLSVDKDEKFMAKLLLSIDKYKKKNINHDTNNSFVNDMLQKCSSEFTSSQGDLKNTFKNLVNNFDPQMVDGAIKMLTDSNPFFGGLTNLVDKNTVCNFISELKNIDLDKKICPKKEKIIEKIFNELISQIGTMLDKLDLSNMQNVIDMIDTEIKKNVDDEIAKTITKDDIITYAFQLQASGKLPLFNNNMMDKLSGIMNKIV